MAAPFTWTHGYLDANNISIHYLDSASPAAGLAAALPVLIFMHGLMNRVEDLQEAASQFTDMFRVILPDARGHGLSKPIPPFSFTPENMDADARALVVHFATDGAPVYLMGHSMGGTTAASVALRHPELVSALVLEDPPWSYLPTSSYEEIASAVSGFATIMLTVLKDMPTKTDEEFADTWLGFFGSAIDPDYMASLRAFDIYGCETTLVATDRAMNQAVVNLTIPVFLQGGNSTLGAKLMLPTAAKALFTWKNENRFTYFPEGAHELHAAPTAAKWLAQTRNFLARQLKRAAKAEALATTSESGDRATAVLT